MKRDLEKVQDELAEETSRCREAMENYSQVLDENAILRKKNKGSHSAFTLVVPPLSKKKARTRAHKIVLIVRPVLMASLRY